ncbi:MAG: TrkH family potassium uptake protein [Eggerthellaceae bacterium]|nr:TrkH family potassium uptake protein [Eggerthellaceae bacterium]
MWQRFTLYDLRVIGHYLGTLVMYSTLLMVLPLLVAIVFGEWEPACRYLFSIGITLFSGSILRFCYINPSRLNAQQAVAVVGLAWIVLGLFCSIPLYFSGHYLSFIDAVFDGVSGLTTTGASLILDLDHLSYADNTFRFMMHLLGGLGLIVVALSLGIFGKRSGASLYRSEGRSEHVVPNVVHTTRFIAKVTAILITVSTVLVMIVMLISGIEPARAALQAFWVSISGFVTGGFTPMQQSILYYHSMPLEFILMVLMVMGSISFVIYSAIWKGNVQPFFKDIETRTTLLWIGLMVVVFTASMAASNLFSDLPTLLRRGTFMIISSFTTTGFSVISVNQLLTVLTSGAFFSLALVMAVGGGTGSTAGGIKVYRVGIIAKSIVSTVKQAVAPNSARVVVSYNHMGRRILSPVVVKEAMTVFILYVITYVIGALIGIAHGYDATQAIFESVAMTSNGGIITGIAAPGMPVTLELFYILQMWAGRLEFITLLALFAQVIASVVPRKSRFHMNNGADHGKGRPRSRERHLGGTTMAVLLALVLVGAPLLSSCAPTHVLSDDAVVADAASGEQDAQAGQDTSVSDDSAEGAMLDDSPASDANVSEGGEGIEGAAEQTPDVVHAESEHEPTDVTGQSADGSDPSEQLQDVDTGIDEAGVVADEVPKDNRVNTSQLPDSSFIYDASIADLETADPYMNEQTVQVVGEVVGDRIDSEFIGDDCWILLQATDKSYSEVSVIMPYSMSSVIDRYGSYGNIGTKIQVRGTFHLACKDHEGLSDLHAEHVTLVSPGAEMSSPVNSGNLIWGIVLLVLSLVSIFSYNYLRERQR